MKRNLVSISVLSVFLLVACSGDDPELKLYCSYQQKSFEITRQAWDKFKTHPSNKEITDEQWRLSSEWQKQEHKKLRAQLFNRDDDYFALNDKATDRGWLPSTCNQ